MARRVVQAWLVGFGVYSCSKCAVDSLDGDKQRKVNVRVEERKELFTGGG
jgi:hypothetical protein